MSVPTQRKVLQSAMPLGDLWSIQESLLQAYRAIFITAESVMFALGASMVVGARGWMVLPVAVLGLTLIPFWVAVCRARARAVTFIHWMIHRFEDGESVEQPYTRFREFQTTRTYHGAAVEQDPLFVKLSASKTRKRMDGEIPFLFAAMWFVLLGFTYLLGRGTA